MKPKKLYTAIGIVCIALLANCNKSSKTAPSTKSMIDGKWLLTGIADDLNNNGKLDAGEIMADSSNTALVFNDNGTGIETDNSGSAPDNFLWRISSDNQFLLLTDTSYGSYNAISFHIDSLKLPTMVLRDTSGGNLGWAILKKQ